MAKLTKTLAFVVYPGVSLLELEGTLGSLRGLMLRGYRVTTVGAATGAIATGTPLRIAANDTFETAPRPEGIVVPGASPLAALQALGDEALVGYVRTAAAKAELIASVGSGSLLLAAAGLLEDRTAATHWAVAGLLARLGARPTRARWHDGGRIVTASGGSGGLDMAIHLLARLGSRSQAQLVQLFGEYDPHPPFGALDPASLDPSALVPLVETHRDDLEVAWASRPKLLAALEDLLRPPTSAYTPPPTPASAVAPSNARAQREGTAS